jgi:hypothetical protein
MNPKSLLMILANPPQIRLQNDLLKDYVSTEIDGVPVFAGVAPWRTMHDLLVDRETQTLAGFIYQVEEKEQAAVAALCQSLPSTAIRYCISLARANEQIHDPQFRLSDALSESGDVNAAIEQFPAILQPFRQAINSCLLGGIELHELPDEVREIAAQYFKEVGGKGWTKETARVEVTWVNKPVIDSLPSYFPSAFEIELAQYFAEDIWFYREDNRQIYAVGFNHLDETLESYELDLPDSINNLIA